MKISIISPVYLAENIVEELVKQIEDSLKRMGPDYEIILVEDGSPDNSWSRIRQVCDSNQHVVGVKLSRNFGQHFAITAGLDLSSGDVAIVMDCDLQDDPKYFADLIHAYEEGYDIVYTSKAKREHSFWKNLTASVFTGLFNYLTATEKSRLDVGSFTLISRKVVDSFNRIEDKRRHFLMVLRTLGFSSTAIPVNHNKRFEGESSYSFSKLLKHALDSITSQSDKLLRMSIYLGFAFAVFSFFGALWITYRKFAVGFQAGWATLVVLVLFSSGVILICLGILGVYLGRVFEQTKNHPLYLIDQTINLNE